MRFLENLILILAVLCVQIVLCSLDDFEEDFNEHLSLDHQDSLHEEMEKVKDLPPDEAKEQLKKLVSRIDLNHDALITKEELTKWISDSLKKNDQDQAQYHLKENDENKDDFMTFEEYLKRSYGYTPKELEDLKKETSEESIGFLKTIKEDQYKFTMADLNKDGKLDLAEFAAFHHPSQYDHMREFETKVHMEHFDVNKDGFISLNEFASSDQPETLTAERVHFEHFDLNKDGKLDLEEVKAWANPGYESTAKEESDHLFEQSDLNRDGNLTEEEIISDYETWMTSHATDYGDHLHKIKRDEL